jgi:hypothetical protein
VAKPRLVLTGSLLAILVAAATVITPYWVMRPFRSQGPTELMVALTTLRVAPWVLAAMVALALWMVVRGWSSGWLRRIITVLALLVVLGGAALSRINPFEEMFAPLPRRELVALADAPWAADDVMMTVRVGEAVRAYPVRVVAYHHVLNDVLGDTPLAVTY